MKLYLITFKNGNTFKTYARDKHHINIILDANMLELEPIKKIEKMEDLKWVIQKLKVSVFQKILKQSP